MQLDAFVCLVIVARDDLGWQLSVHEEVFSVEYLEE